MPFTIPNSADAAYAAQAAPDKVDFDILAALATLTGVNSGCAATVTGSDMNVTIGSGRATINGTEVIVASGAVTIPTAHATYPRFDLLVVNTSGTKSVQSGTAAANPVFPAIPANSVVL